MRLDTVKQILHDSSPDLAARFGVTTILIFGSVARGEDRPGSDVDILVEFDRPVTLFHLFDLRHHLECLLGSDVDVGTIAGLKPRIRDKVIAEAVRVA
jgi:predicted nucleotidyltransferase